MSKLSPKDWLRLLGIYAVGAAFLCSLPFIFRSLKRGIIAIPGFETFYKSFLQQVGAWIIPWIPGNITLYFIILVGVGVVYFLVEDIFKLIRGKRDSIEEKELALDEQILSEISKEYGEKAPFPLSQNSNKLSLAELEEELQKTKIAPNIQRQILETAQNHRKNITSPSHFERSFRYFPIVHYWISGILLFGLVSAWGMAIVYPEAQTGLGAVSLILLGSSLYLLFLARASTRRIYLETQHVWLGKNEKNLFCEKNYDSVYFMHFLVRAFWSIEKRYSLLVFRKGFCFPPFHYFIDRFLPASNSKRQVIFFNIWKDESGEMVNDASLTKRILIHCDEHKIPVKQWTCEAQFFLTVLILSIVFILWIFWR